jgi:putative NADH-flavin reductase
MKVIVFGSTGTIGKHLIRQSLNKGYEVKAFCRNKAALSNFTHSRLIKSEGDVFNLDDIYSAIKGQDIVIITLGSGKDRNSIVRSEGTKISFAQCNRMA